MMMAISVRAMVTSYEMVWANPRMAPNKENLEFDDQPAARVVYAFILERHKNSIMAYDKLMLGDVEGMIIHRERDRVMFTSGLLMKINGFDGAGLFSSFVKSLMASGIG